MVEKKLHQISTFDDNYRKISELIYEHQENTFCQAISEEKEELEE